MRIEKLSIRAATVAIFVMIGTVACALSFLAGEYFRRAALDAQMNSLSRVIEVASQEMLKAVRGHTFELGMRLGHSRDMNRAMQAAVTDDDPSPLIALLDDPFINGFVGFANINLEKIRVFDLDLELIAESSKGLSGLGTSLDQQLAQTLAPRRGSERLKAVDALWISPRGALYSTVVPVGGLNLIGYLEIIINPVFNLPDIGAITRTPISIFTPAGKTVLAGDTNIPAGHLPVEYPLMSSAGEPAFRIVGYENVEKLNASMENTRLITISGFLLLTLGTLLFALWLFNRFLFIPVKRMVQDMQQMAGGKLDLTISDKGLREFSILAGNFNAMANQVRLRSNDLERLLDMDDAAILCFGRDQELVYFNLGAAGLFGHARDEIGDLDFNDLFADDIAGLLKNVATPDMRSPVKLHAQLHCIRRDGGQFERDAVIRLLDVMGGRSMVVVLNAIAPGVEHLSAEAVVSSVQRNEQRMNAVEQSLNSLLEIARTSPGLVSPGSGIELHAEDSSATGDDRPAIRELAVKLMLSALACWERDLGRSKIDLAEESRIWPVYIDKSTPTTRTLDKYLNIESCPNKPRTQRVIDTAEFVLKQLGRKSSADRKLLQQNLTDFRQLISGMKSA